MAISLGILTQHFQTNPYCKDFFSWLNPIQTSIPKIAAGIWDISCQILLGARCGDRWTGNRWYIACIGFMYVCMHACITCKATSHLFWCGHREVFDPSPYLIMLSRQNITHLVDQWWTSLTSDVDSSLEKGPTKYQVCPIKGFSLPNLSPVFLQMTRLDWLDPMFTWPFKHSANFRTSPVRLPSLTGVLHGNWHWEYPFVLVLYKFLTEYER